MSHSTLELRYSSAFPLSVAVVSQDGWPTGLPRSGARLAPVREVTPDDDVVLVYGSGTGPAVQELHMALGTAMPPVIALATGLDFDDLALAMGHGVTSYLIEGRRPGCPDGGLEEAVRGTASRLSFLDAEIAYHLIQRIWEHIPSPLRPAETPPPRLMETLTARERQIMDRLAAGEPVAEIARQVSLTEKTVRNYLSRIYAKLQVNRQSEAILCWLGRTPS